ncbi:hypothetical protein FACS1894122_14890 [Alphaproteobacteria bacterium]|nr:hypothetical protein FACS1894122_14890 [Alphaproteobacteria bacterium]
MVDEKEYSAQAVAYPNGVQRDVAWDFSEYGVCSDPTYFYNGCKQDFFRFFDLNSGKADIEFDTIYSGAVAPADKIWPSRQTGSVLQVMIITKHSD